MFGLLRVIHKDDLIAWYGHLSSYGVIHGVKLPSLKEFLDLSLKEKSTEEINSGSAFDESTDKEMEALALKRLEELKGQVNV